MRIYNATNAQMNLPFPGGTVSIAPHSVSGNLGANTQTISMLVTAYNTSEMAFIVSGPFELNLCASIPTVVNYVVQSLEEAIERLEPKPEKTEAKVEVKKVEKVDEFDPDVDEEDSEEESEEGEDVEVSEDYCCPPKVSEAEATEPEEELPTYDLSAKVEEENELRKEYASTETISEPEYISSDRKKNNYKSYKNNKKGGKH